MSLKGKIAAGFTLLELLVVISIIGILVALGAVAFTAAQQKGRDARRQGDLKSVQNAFEQYHAQNGDYNATPTTCSGMATAELLSGGLPIDPRPSQSYTYSCPDVSTYCVCAQLESETGNAGAADCSDWSPGGYFCVKNLQ